MKVILSRKGFDSANGGQASPILPDGTMLSLPIPSHDRISFSELQWHGFSYLDIIRQLNPKTLIDHDSHCHLDPDLREEVRPRKPGWMPAFGQKGSPLSELHNNAIAVGDLFLFYGWFRQTAYHDGKPCYLRGAKDIHAIYGYLQIGRIIREEKEIPEWLREHPHANHARYEKDWKNRQNAIFLPSPRLSLCPDMLGAGTFTYDRRRVLTKEGCSRSRSTFPEAMRGTPISHCPNGWKEDYFQSAAIGQEFVMDATPPVLDWLKAIFRTET
ncbi:MAG: hypothetical protein J6Y23_04560 [Prevotella sp.]|nr:hypothetical protein [Prevotella sp.]